MHRDCRRGRLPTAPRGRRLNRRRGFTLVELLTVVAILGITVGLAIYSLRGKRGETGPEFARALVDIVHETREAAFARNVPTRIRLRPTTPQMQAVTEVATTGTPSLSTDWLPLGAVANAPDYMTFCMPHAASDLGTYAPTCDLASETRICVMPNGRVSVVAGNVDACPGPNPFTGATIFFHDLDDKAHFKVVMFALTGLPKLKDVW